MIKKIFLPAALLFHLSLASIVTIGDDKQMDPLNGRICGIADMNKDGNADLIVQQRTANKLVIYLQSENGEFKESKNTTSINLGSASAGMDVFCSVGDFNGDTCPDLLVVQQIPENLDIIGKIKAVFTSSSPKLRYMARVFMSERGENFTEHNFCNKQQSGEGQNGATVQEECTQFIDHPILLDINGDGVADIFGFEAKEDSSGNGNRENISLFCREGHNPFGFKQCENVFGAAKPNPHIFTGFAPIFADLDGDLSAEIVYMEMVEENNSAAKKKLVVWRRKPHTKSDYDWELSVDMSSEVPKTESNLGSPLVGDIDSDGSLEILLPVCDSEACDSVSKIFCYKFNKEEKLVKWVDVAIDLNDGKGKKATIHPEVDGQSKLIFRIGDFSQNGFPDLIATMTHSDGMKMPTILDNVVDLASNFTRKFELSKAPLRILPKEVADIGLSTFFDLKEDGNLDILYEYKKDSDEMLNFIKCDEKGDTTFLKVQIFTGDSCYSKDCCESETESSRHVKIGSGIGWHGACVWIKMADSSQGGVIEAGTRLSAQCQLPQTSHRILHNPFMLFGLTRSPNFVDEVHLGGPRRLEPPKFQQDMIRQIVPNSRVIVIPPKTDNDNWTSRLYVTPSRLIILSILVMVSMCVILLLLIGFLHFRERQQDKKERQAQTHRFHFDAM